MADCLFDHEKIGMLSGKVKLKDGNFLCKAHWKKLGFNSTTDVNKIEKITTELAVEYLTSGKSLKDQFNLEKQSSKDIYTKTKLDFKRNNDLVISNVYFSNDKKQLFIDKNIYTAYSLIDYSDIQAIKANVNDKTVEKHHRITRGVIGGTLLGPTGAAIGALTGGNKYTEYSRLSVSLILKGHPIREVTFLTTKTKADSILGKLALKELQQFVLEVERIIANNQQPDFNGADEILKYKKLLDEEIITQEEFNTKKKELLGL